MDEVHGMAHLQLEEDRQQSFMGVRCVAWRSSARGHWASSLFLARLLADQVLKPGTQAALS